MFQRCRNLTIGACRLQKSNIQRRYESVLSKDEFRKRKNLIFDEVKKKQISATGRIQKIEVKYFSPIEEVTLIMNRNLSTPADCAKHISEGVAKVSALALVDNQPWDMHKPLTNDCTLSLLNLLSPSTNVVNVAFWRTCSFLLGAVIDSAFKEDVKVHLHSFPAPVIKSGSFVHDVYLELPEWKPTANEIRAIAAVFKKLITQELPLERLETNEEVAMQIFEDNPLKLQQIPSIAKANNNSIVLYRVGDHIDISKGPMVGNTSLIGRCSIAAVHKLQDRDNIYRFQGIALPEGILLNHFAYGILENRARKLNNESVSYQVTEDNEDAPLQISATN